VRSGEGAAVAPAETDTVRRIAARLDQLDPQVAKYLAAFAYVLARVAHADLAIHEAETREMQETVRSVGNLLECLYAVAAADGSISTIESQEIQSIADELGFTRAEANALRSRYRDRLGVLRKP
jgi:uncharacterized tellurite resistance protein B-like protein